MFQVHQTKSLLLKMLHVFVEKFKTIAKLQNPNLRRKQLGSAKDAETKASSGAASTDDASSNTAVLDNIQADVKSEDSKDASKAVSVSEEKDKESSLKIGTTPNVIQNCLVNDCKALVKTLISGVKTITWGLPTRNENEEGKRLETQEIEIYIRYIKWSLQALDVYMMNSNMSRVVPPGKTSSNPAGRTKEEKEVLDHFAGCFTMLDTNSFREIISIKVGYFVDKILSNPALQSVANTFLANSRVSPVFAMILLEYLLKHMEEIGTPVEKSSQYLKLFKLIFGSVSLFHVQNEQILKPCLHQIVNKSMEFATSAKEPYNYFLLLRALFRSIGGGNHDLLYQEFLPLLPSLLQGLNCLQSGLHKQHMKDLFVELCLTVPVRLSSLLPYLPMLMDPLVSALNGSPILVSQGLRTLELCVDNLQPDFLYEHIQPVRAELMQALWRTLRNKNEEIAQNAFRVLGKFGGGNRKMMVQPQKLDFEDSRASSTCITVNLNGCTAPINLPVEKIIDVAFSALKTSNTDPWYRQQCWEVIRSFIIGSMIKDTDKAMLLKLLTHPSFREGEIFSGEVYKCPDDSARQVHKTALTAMLVAAAIKELSKAVLPTMVKIVRHYTMVAVVQQAGPFNVRDKLKGIDPTVVVDAIAEVMGHEEKELCKPGHVALLLMITSSSEILGSKDRAARLPLMEYVSQKMSELCYQRAWYAKLGGCLAIKVLIENMPLKWVLEHQTLFLKALTYVIMDLTGEVSTGAVDMAKANLDKMLHVCASPLTPPNDTGHMPEIQDKSVRAVVQELVLLVTASNSNIREQTQHSLRTLGELTGKGVTKLMEPHIPLLTDTIPPKKQLLRHQPANVQIGLMEGNTFCTTLEPKLYKLDVGLQEHYYFLNELVGLVNNDDTQLRKVPCYKNVTNLIPIRKAAIKALSACHYVSDFRDKVFIVIYKSMCSHASAEINEASFEALRIVIDSGNIPRDFMNTQINNLMRNLIANRPIVTISKKIIYHCQLVPWVFKENVSNQLVNSLISLLDTLCGGNKEIIPDHNDDKSVSEQRAARDTKKLSDIKTVSEALNLLYELPNVGTSNMERLVTKIIEVEKNLNIEASSPLREPLVRYLILYPQETFQIFLSTTNGSNEHWGRLLEFCLKHECSSPLRNAVECNISQLICLLESFPDLKQLQYVAVRLIHLVCKWNPDWIAQQPTIVAALRKLWGTEEVQQMYQNSDNIASDHWRMPRMIVSTLLNYYKVFPGDISLLYELVRLFTGRYIADFHFLTTFLEDVVAKTYSVQWKRKAFFEMVQLFRQDSTSQAFKVNVIQYVTIPCFIQCIEQNQVDEFICLGKHTITIEYIF